MWLSIAERVLAKAESRPDYRSIGFWIAGGASLPAPDSLRGPVVSE